MTNEKELLARTYAAFNARDIDAVLETMHPDVDWPNGMEGGRMRGRAAVRRYWERQWTMINPRVDPLSFVTGRLGSTIVEVHQLVRDPGGKVLTDRVIRHVYEFRDGLIARMEIAENAAQESRG